MDISKKDMESYHRLLSQIQERSKSTFNRLVEAGLKANPAIGDEEFLKLVEKSMISTTLSFGDAASSIALDFFTDTTGFSANNSDIARLPFGVNDKIRERVTQYAQNNEIKSGDFKEICGNLVASEVLQQANRTTSKAGARNGMKFARVPQGGECSFCAWLASFGFHYTEEGANSHYHDHCRCKVVAGKPGTKVGGYQPELIRSRFKEVADSIGLNVNNAKDKKAILKECARRDSNWLNGRVPRVTFTDEVVKEDILKNHKKEYESALRMIHAGIPCCFQQDYREYFDAFGIKQSVGKADFTCGLELKALEDTSSYNTIDGYLKNASKKEDCTWVIFDNSVNQNMTDEQLKEHLLKSRRFKDGRIYYFGHDLKVYFVR
ncbi:hypothetical protein [Lancefieldella parvula]|uniref:VG15 protein n=1 Tax=Lancefieldella parvula TaxID=1382 RepID=UPI0028E899EF|nr:hypothetical protein [Lancefieldella parvula]